MQCLVYYMTSMRLIKGILYNVQFDQIKAAGLCKRHDNECTRIIRLNIAGSSPCPWAILSHCDGPAFMTDGLSVGFIQTVICNRHFICFIWTIILACILNAELTFSYHNRAIEQSVNFESCKCKKWVNTLDL